MKKTNARKPAVARAEADRAGPINLRIIGGEFRGRKLKYSGDPRTRPMKDRVREAVFNLVRGHVAGRIAIDLFAGTGALGLEALSRGAARALFLERHFPTARIIRENAATLGVTDRVEILSVDTLAWSRRVPAEDGSPWLVFCSPPFDLYVERPAELLALIERLMAEAPPESAVVVESDQRFELATLPHAAEWDVRSYPPAVVGVWYKPAETNAD